MDHICNWENILSDYVEHKCLIIKGYTQGPVEDVIAHGFNLV